MKRTASLMIWLIGELVAVIHQHHCANDAPFQSDAGSEAAHWRSARYPSDDDIANVEVTTAERFSSTLHQLQRMVTCWWQTGCLACNDTTRQQYNVYFVIKYEQWPDTSIALTPIRKIRNSVKASEMFKKSTMKSIWWMSLWLTRISLCHCALKRRSSLYM